MQYRTYLAPVLAAALALSAICHAAPPSVPAFFNNPEISMVRLSPKGGYVATVIALPNGSQALAIRDTAAPEKMTITTSTTDQERFVDVHWINEDRIGFTIKNLRVEFDGNYDEFAAERGSSAVLHLISGNWGPVRRSTQHVPERVLTADYGYFDVPHDGSDDILVEKYNWNNTDLAPQSSRLYRLNTRTRILGGVIDSGHQPQGRELLIDTRGVPRIGMTVVKGRCVTWYRAADADDWDEIANTDCHADTRFKPLFFDGSDTLYVQAPHQGYNALFRYHLKTRQRDAEPMVSVPGYDFAGSPVIEYASRKVLGLRLETDASTTVWLYASMKELQAKVDALLPGRINTIHCPDDCRNSPVLLISSASDRLPEEYLLYYRAGNKVTGLGSSHPGIDPAQMGKRHYARYAARDGMQIPVYVTLPPALAGGKAPAIVLVHGGPDARGASWEWNAEAQFLASRGYVVIEPQYRGSTGFGAAHFQAGWKQWGLAMQDDLADAARWAIREGWADPKRIGIMGASYGGYATLMGLINDPQLFRAGVAWAGVTDIDLMFSSARTNLREESLNYGMRVLVGDPDKDAEQFKRTSPLRRAAEIKQPLLIAHGAEDRVVPVEHATKFRDAVKAGNASVTSIIYNNEGHGWSHEDNNIDFWTRVEAFLEQHLKHAN